MIMKKNIINLIFCALTGLMTVSAMQAMNQDYLTKKEEEKIKIIVEQFKILGIKRNKNSDDDIDYMLRELAKSPYEPVEIIDQFLFTVALGSHKTFCFSVEKLQDRFDIWVKQARQLASEPGIENGAHVISHFINNVCFSLAKPTWDAERNTRTRSERGEEFKKLKESHPSLIVEDFVNSLFSQKRHQEILRVEKENREEKRKKREEQHQAAERLEQERLKRDQEIIQKKAQEVLRKQTKEDNSSGDSIVLDEIKNDDEKGSIKTLKNKSFDFKKNMLLILGGSAFVLGVGGCLIYVIKNKILKKKNTDNVQK
jgi:hypothetical protein